MAGTLAQNGISLPNFSGRLLPNFGLKPHGNLLNPPHLQSHLMQSALQAMLSSQADPLPSAPATHLAAVSASAAGQSPGICLSIPNMFLPAEAPEASLPVLSFGGTQAPSLPVQADQPQQGHQHEACRAGEWRQDQPASTTSAACSTSTAVTITRCVEGHMY
jgi:hypothetical protein